MITKMLLVVCFITGVFAAITFIYGFVKFPDAPIRETITGYAGKTGVPHTREDYEQFLLWEKVTFISFGLTFLLGFGVVATEKISQQRRR